MKSLGNFILRVPPELHVRLKAEARASGLSLNEFCTRILETHAESGSGRSDSLVHELVNHGRRVLGDNLVGIILYGSWVRGEATDSSDIDVMLVANSNMTITRTLISKWDQFPLTFDGRPVEAHIVAMPKPNDTFSGLWAELAIDGIVLFEHEFEISRILARTRQEIATGRLQRRRSHGQNYWLHSDDGVA